MKKFVCLGLVTFGMLLFGQPAQAAEITNDVAPELGKIYIDERESDLTDILCTTSEGRYVINENKLVLLDKEIPGVTPFIYHDVQLLSGDVTGYSFTIAGNTPYTYLTTNHNSDWSPRAMIVNQNGAQIQYWEVYGTPASIADTTSATATYYFGLRNLSSSAMNYGMNMMF